MNSGELGLKNHTTDTIAALATRIAGSSAMYQPYSRRPCNSINFITSHDGFTLADLVSYNEKHNLENGEENWDGADNNISWNSVGQRTTCPIFNMQKRLVVT